MVVVGVQDSLTYLNLLHTRQFYATYKSCRKVNADSAKQNLPAAESASQQLKVGD